MNNAYTTVVDYYILSDISNSDIQPQIWNFQPRILISEDFDVWIWRLAYISSAEVLGFRYPAEGFIKSGLWINWVEEN